jgi:hypothetical protein
MSWFYAGRIVERQFQSDALAATHPANGMLEVDPVVASASLERTLGGRNDGGVCEFEGQDHRPRLHARALLGHHEFAAMKTDARFREQSNNLKREHMLAVTALMQGQVILRSQPE